MSNMVVQMHVDRCGFAHNRLNCHQVLPHPVEILFLIPHIAVHFFLKGFQFVNIQFLFCLFYRFRNFRVTADIHFFCIVCTAGKRWVDVHKVNLNALFLEVSTGGNTFSTDYHITVFVFAHGFLLFHFI